MQLKLTKTVKALLIICFTSFVIQQTWDQFLGGNITGTFGLVPYAFVMKFYFWQIFTYSFLHADLAHLILNLLMLVFIGGDIESVWGWARFLRFYAFCALSGGLAYLLLQLAIGQSAVMVPMVGASGAIYGLLLAYGLLYSERELYFMMLFPMKAKHFIWILVVVEFMTTVFSQRGGVAGIAHLGGMAGGLAFLWWRSFWIVWKERKKREAGAPTVTRRTKKKSADHLKLIVNRDDDDPRGPKTWH